jgi:hypothetical protein
MQRLEALVGEGAYQGDILLVAGTIVVYLFGGYKAGAVTDRG